MTRRPGRSHSSRPYFLFSLGALLVALIGGWTPFATQIDNYHYDWTLRLYPPQGAPSHTAILDIDDATLRNYSGIRQLRGTLAKALVHVVAVNPKAVAVDLILAEESEILQDAALRRSFDHLPNLVLSADLIAGDIWEEPYKLFRPAAKAVGHVHAEPDRYDGVSRQIQLEKATGRDRKWALALEAWRLVRGGNSILESPSDLEIAGALIPIPKRGAEGRAMFIRYRRGNVERVSVKDVIENPSKAELFRDRVVFVGVTSQSQARDRLNTPYSNGVPMPGVEIHAHIYETIAEGEFYSPASNTAVMLMCVVLAAAAGLSFVFVGGRLAYAAGVAIILIAHLMPHVAFHQQVVFPLLAPAGTAWLSVIACAAYQYFATRVQLNKSEEDRTRYQQAIHFVSHEMKSPLTAIQGSSELMSRYNLSDEKRKQIAQMINSESKRLARMIQAFLDVERLSAGQMDLKREPFSILDLVIVCVERARPLAEHKRIQIDTGDIVSDTVVGDRELMEYAVYNLLSNAVKYSPPETRVSVLAERQAALVRIAVRDEGIGMDEKEIKRIGTRFYRTKRAEASGESGSGIGLSIVGQIVDHHSGRLEITSTPGQGSCFTIVVPVANAPKAAEVRS